MISDRIPGGNIKVIEAKENTFLLDVDMRDSEGVWFYWKFKAVFPAAGRYCFRFQNAPKIGTCGPAISFDAGKTWRWQKKRPDADAQSFSFECSAPQEVWFCQAMPYQQREFDAFAGDFQNHRAFRLSELCRSRGGRAVELLQLGENANAPAVLLTSRHHAQEMMATHAMEGFLRAVLAENAFGAQFRGSLTVYAVPFVDKDGVESGAQGKNRIPHDHGRDYGAASSIYPECAAIRALVEEKKPFFILDMHCPWIRGGASNEEFYMVDGEKASYSLEMERFGAILEQESPPETPYLRKNNIRFGTLWNTPENYRNGRGLKHFGAEHDFVRFSQTLEIPFANIGGRSIDRNDMLTFGEALARSVLRYSDELRRAEK